MVIPQIRPTIIVVVTTLIVIVTKVFDLVKATPNGANRTNVLANEMFDQLRDRNFTSSSAFAVVLFALVLPVMVYNIRRLQRSWHDRRADSRRRLGARSWHDRRAERGAAHRTEAAPAGRGGPHLGDVADRDPVDGATLGLFVSSFRKVPDIETSAGGRPGTTSTT